MKKPLLCGCRFTDAAPVERAVLTYQRLRTAAQNAGRRWQRAAHAHERVEAAHAYHLALARRDRARRAITAAAIRVFGRK